MAARIIKNVQIRPPDDSKVETKEQSNNSEDSIMEEEMKRYEKSRQEFKVRKIALVELVEKRDKKSQKKEKVDPTPKKRTRIDSDTDDEKKNPEVKKTKEDLPRMESSESEEEHIGMCGSKNRLSDESNSEEEFITIKKTKKTKGQRRKERAAKEKEATNKPPQPQIQSPEETPMDTQQEQVVEPTIQDANEEKTKLEERIMKMSKFQLELNLFISKSKEKCEKKVLILTLGGEIADIFNEMTRELTEKRVINSSKQSKKPETTQVSNITNNNNFSAIVEATVAEIKAQEQNQDPSGKTTANNPNNKYRQTNGCGDPKSSKGLPGCT